MSILNNLKDTVTDVADKVETAVGDSDIKDTIENAVENSDIKDTIENVVTDTANSVVSSIDTSSILSSVFEFYKTPIIIVGVSALIISLMSISGFILSIISVCK